MKRQNKVYITMIFILILLIISPINTYASCEGLIGSPTDTKSPAWLIQEIFSIVKYMGPFLVLVLSSIDFAKTIIQNDEETMKKAQKKLIIRLILTVALFFIPTFIFTILQIFDVIGNPNDPTCGIK